MSSLPHIQGLRALVIDDSQTIRRTAKVLLEREGLEVLLAEDGFDSLHKIVQFNPQVIFVDIMMPRLDGYQTCAIIRRNQRFQSVPVIMLSSKDGLFDRAKARVMGATYYLTKPFSQDELRTALLESFPIPDAVSA